MTVDDALTAYMKGDLALFPPQVIMLTTFKFLNFDFAKLRAHLRQLQVNPQSYLTNRGTVIIFKQIEEQEGEKSEKTLMKQTRHLYSDYDLLPDKEREDTLYVFTDEDYIRENPHLAVFSKAYDGKRTHEDICKALKACTMHLYFHDFKSIQSSVMGYTIGKNQRQRGYMAQGVMRIFRLEVSKSVLHN